MENKRLPLFEDFKNPLDRYPETIKKEQIGNKLVVSNFDYFAPLHREMEKLGAKWDSKKRTLTLNPIHSQEVDDILNSYYGDTKPMTPYQKKIKDQLMDAFGGDAFMRKTDKGLFVVDVNDNHDIEGILRDLGLEVDNIQNDTRYFIKLK